MVTKRPEMAEDKSLKGLVEQRQEQLLAIREIKTDLSITEGAIMGGLIRDKMYDMFTINWRRLDAMIYKRGKYARH